MIAALHLWRAWQPTVTIVHADVTRRLESIDASDFDHVLVIAHHRGAVVGQVSLPGRRTLTPAQQWDAIVRELEPAIRLNELRARIGGQLDVSADGEAAARPTVAVIVCTRDRPEQLRLCLDGLAALDPPADQVLVVDNAPSDGRTRALCEQAGVSYVLEELPGQSRARNRGLLESESEIVAFTDDDCVPDRGWLANLGEAFRDPLVMAVTGYIGPLEVSAPAQWFFEAHGGFERHSVRTVFDALSSSPAQAAAAAGAGANMLFRRSVFDEVGGFAEDLGPGTPTRSADDKYAYFRILTAGYRILHEPQRIVWHRHRSDWPALRRILNDYGTSEIAWSSRVLLEGSDPGAVRIWSWWARHFAADGYRLLRGRANAVPLELTAQEVRGALTGPRAMRRAAGARRHIRQLRPRSSPAQSPAVTVRAADDPALSVAVASYNRRDSLRLTLHALAEQDYPPERWEVVLTLDGSTDGSAEMASALALPYRLRVHVQPNRGLAAARNHGARAASHPLVVFLDDDIRPEAGFLAAHAEAHRLAPRGHLALGHYPPVTGQDLPSLLLRAWWSDHFRRLAEPGHRWTFTDICDGNASLFTKDLDAVGGFDEEFSGGRRRQDWEFGLRVLSAGFPPRFHPRALGRHHLDTRVETMLRNARQEARDDVLLGQKHPGIRAALPFASLDAEAWAAFPRDRALRLVSDTSAAGRLLAALEACGLRGRWRRLLHRLYSLNYARGLEDSLPDPGEHAAFLDPSAWTFDDLVLDLDRGEVTPATPADGVPRALRVKVLHRGQMLAAVPAVVPGGQWDTGLLVDRIAEDLDGVPALSDLLRS